MKGSKILALLLSAVCAAPVLAAQRVKRAVPSAGSGSVVGLDPEVAAFQQKMTEITARIKTIEANLKAIKIPNFRLGAIAAKAAIAVELAALAEAKAEAKAAGDRIKAYLAGVPSGTRTYGKMLAKAEFDSKQDSAGLKPKDDRIMRGAAKGPSSSGGGFSATEGFSGQNIASKPALQKVGSHFGYSASGGGTIGAGFSSTMEPSSSQQTMQINAGGATGQSGGSVGAGAGGSGIGGSTSGTAGPDARPSVNPTSGLSVNTSDVEQKAYERQQKMLDDKAQREEESRKEEQQRKQQQQQMAMQAAMQAASKAAEAAQKAAEGEQGQGGGGGGGGQQAVDDQLAQLNQQIGEQTERANQATTRAQTAEAEAKALRDAKEAEAKALATSDPAGSAAAKKDAATAESGPPT